MCVCVSGKKDVGASNDSGAKNALRSIAVLHKPSHPPAITPTNVTPNAKKRIVGRTKKKSKRKEQ